jgi:hypothetical protein
MNNATEVQAYIANNECEVNATGSEAKHIIELLMAESQGRIVVLPCKIGDVVRVDARTLPWHYLHPADRCGDWANCKIIGFAVTKKQTFTKLVALYPSRMNRRGYLKRSIGAIGKTVLLTEAPY